MRHGHECLLTFLPSENDLHADKRKEGCYNIRDNTLVKRRQIQSATTSDKLSQRKNPQDCFTPSFKSLKIYIYIYFSNESEALIEANI